MKNYRAANIGNSTMLIMMAMMMKKIPCVALVCFGSGDCLTDFAS